MTIEQALNGLAYSMICMVMSLLIVAVAALCGGGIVLLFLKAWKYLHAHITEEWLSVPKPGMVLAMKGGKK